MDDAIIITDSNNTNSSYMSTWTKFIFVQVLKLLIDFQVLLETIFRPRFLPQEDVFYPFLSFYLLTPISQLLLPETKFQGA